MHAVRHEPVLTREVLGLLAPERGGLFVDCTVGGGGHSAALLEAGATRVIGCDRDPSALAAAAAGLRIFGDRIELVHADFREIDAVLDARGVGAIDGALADLGMSSLQLQSPGRGFSFVRDEPLDMRMDQTAPGTAADLIAAASERELAEVIHRYGEERYARRIARAVVHARADAPIRTTGRLAGIVRRAVPHRGWTRIDPATRTFQALRIWVNRELEGLDAFLARLLRRLSAGARAAVIAFHSLEDRIVKHTFRSFERTGASPEPLPGEAGSEPQPDVRVRVLTRKPVVASEEEIARNPRARSAKLRAVERVA